MYLLNKGVPNDTLIFNGCSVSYFPLGLHAATTAHLEFNLQTIPAY